MRPAARVRLCARASGGGGCARDFQADCEAEARDEAEAQAQAGRPLRAPQNPFGYNFCGGSHITSPDSDTCDYFDRIPAFWDGEGYLEECRDMVSMSGGRSGSYSRHGGNRRAVYKR